MAETLTCSSQSRSVVESLAGTVKPTDIFYLIETNVTEYGGWGHEIVKKITNEGDFAPYVQHLQQVLRTKVLLIREPRANQKNFYIAITNQAQPKLYHAMLSSYDDLLNVDMSTVAPGRVPEINGQPMTEMDELYAVCTNGKHDACCSTLGIPVYNAMVQQAGADKVWQVSHMGGHRFAATLIAFPQGIQYGYLDPHHAEEVVINHRAGYILTHKYRGRSSYGNAGLDVASQQVTEVAEHHVREQEKIYKIDDLSFHEIEKIADMTWRVTLTGVDGKRYQVEVERAMVVTRTSCNEEPKPMPIHTVKAYSN